MKQFEQFERYERFERFEQPECYKQLECYKWSECRLSTRQPYPAPVDLPHVPYVPVGTLLCLEVHCLLSSGLLTTAIVEEAGEIGQSRTVQDF